MTRLYLAGPMSGIPQFNYPEFHRVAAILREDGYEVMSPPEEDEPEVQEAAMASPDGYLLGLPLTWGHFLAKAVRALGDGGFDAVVVLPGWEKSRGARLETFVGRMAGSHIVRPTLVTKPVSLHLVPDLELFRAWCAEPLLSVNSSFGGTN
jgi:hypothetical protein